MKSFKTLTAGGQVRRLRRLALEALTAYAIHEPHLTVLSYGHNTMFRIDLTGGERYVLRIQRPGWGTVESVHSELMWLAALHRDTDLVVPEPVPARDGDLLTVAAVEGVPEPRICVLFGWIAGRFVDAGLTPSHLERVGALMAQLQLHGFRFRPPVGFMRGRLYSLTGKANKASRRGGALVRCPAENADDEEDAIRLVTEACSPQDGARVELLIGKIRQTQRAVGYGPADYGLIHADLHQWNTFFHQGQVRAIDFDDCGYGHYLYDMAVTLSEVTRRQNTPALREGFLAGYRSVRPLSTEQEGRLDTFIALRELQNMIWRIETREQPAFRDNWASIVQAMLEDVRESAKR